MFLGVRDGSWQLRVQQGAVCGLRHGRDARRSAVRDDVPRPWAPDPSDPATAALWMQPLCANTRVCTNAGCLAQSLPVLGASGRDL